MLLLIVVKNTVKNKENHFKTSKMFLKAHQSNHKDCKSKANKQKNQFKGKKQKFDRVRGLDL